MPKPVKTLRVGDEMEISVALVQTLKNQDPVRVRVAGIYADDDGTKTVLMENARWPKPKTETLPGQLRLETT